MKNDWKNKTDEELYSMLSENKAISQKAFEVLYERYSSMVYTYCRKILLNAEVAKDIFQDVFVAFFDYGQKNKKIEKVKAFLFMTTRNLCINSIKLQSNQNIHLDVDTLQSETESYERKQLSELLDEALKKLSPDYREPLILKEFMDLRYSEISEILGLTLDQTRIRISRAKIMLKTLMEPYIEDYMKYN